MHSPLDRRHWSFEAEGGWAAWMVARLHSKHKLAGYRLSIAEDVVMQVRGPMHDANSAVCCHSRRLAPGGGLGLCFGGGLACLGGAEAAYKRIVSQIGCGVAP